MKSSYKLAKNLFPKHLISKHWDIYPPDFHKDLFNKEKINQISKGFEIEDIFELYEGSFPRKLFVVTQRKKRIWNF